MEYRIIEDGEEWLLVPPESNFGMTDLTASEIAKIADADAAWELFGTRHGLRDDVLIELREGEEIMRFRAGAEASIYYYANAE